jgi:hypothetical protein
MDEFELPLEVPLSINNLRALSVSLTISEAHCVRLLLENGRQLESLQLDIYVRTQGCMLSNVLRSFPGPGSFPLLREFAFVLLGGYEDPDLFPAVAEIVRGHPMLEALVMICHDDGNFGFDAAIWGVIPSLIRLRVLSMSFPQDLSPRLCGRLIPRTVVALQLQDHSRLEWGINCDVSISQTE